MQASRVVIIVAAVLALTALPVWGQRDGGDRERGGDDRGGRDRGGGFDPREMLQRMDANANGVIEPSEMSGRGGEFVRRMAERAGVNPNQAMPIDKLAESMRSDRGGGESRDRDRGDRDRDRDRERERDSGNSAPTPSAAKPAPPTGPQAFGATAGESGKVAGFEVPLVNGASTEPIEKRFDARVIEYVKENMLKERDANKNGVLERSEWASGGRWSTPPEESDLNKDGILSMEELCIRIAKRFNLDAASRSPSGGPPVAQPPGGGPPGAPGGDASRFRGYAEGLIRRFDENKNGMLERDESKNISAEQQTSDANKDGVITVDELAAYLQNYSGGSRGPGGYGPRGPGGDSKQVAVKRSYRQMTAIERLPKGMPDWFLRNDLDADGQISMAEYATSWDDKIATEFLKLDANADGIITPGEAQPVEVSRR